MSREVTLEKEKATVEDVLRAVKLKNGSTLFDLIVAENGVKESHVVFLSGQQLQGSMNLGMPIKHNDQFHIMDAPGKVHGGLAGRPPQG